MPVFSQRSYQSELLDQTGIPFEDIRKNMQELEIINKYLGGHRITLTGCKAIISLLLKNNRSAKSLLICEIGCGGGDNLKAIHHWCQKKKIQVQYIGVDNNKECIQYARENCKELAAEWITSDYLLVEFSAKPDIIFSSLFCHHFREEALITQLQWMNRNASAGFFINDLHRHPLAYYSIKLLTYFFSKSYLVKNDAPLSVLRGFSRKEWKHFFVQANLLNGIIEWKWAFRWLIICGQQRIVK